jgi:hypothetical protein
MTVELTVSLWSARTPEPPAGWREFVAEQRLAALWTWPFVNLAATLNRAAVLAATVRDGRRVRALLTGRFVGPRLRPGAVPLGGVFDVDCLLSASMPGVMLESGLDPAARAEVLTATLAALRATLRQRYGRRIGAVMLRQVSAEALPAVLRWPAIVREGGPIAVFHNSFADGDAYFASLSKSRRNSLRSMERRLHADSDVVVTSTLRGEAMSPPLRAADLQLLHRRTVDRNHARWYLRRRVVHLEMAKAQLEHPDVDWIAGHSTAGALLGYESLWQHPEWPYVGLGGSLSPADGGRKDLWFHRNLHLIRWCVESGRPGLVGGQGNMQAKRSLGCTPQRQWAVLIPQHGR